VSYGSDFVVHLRKHGPQNRHMTIFIKYGHNMDYVLSPGVKMQKLRSKRLRRMSHRSSEKYRRVKCTDPLTTIWMS
jgi:hypothetical protein